MSRFSTGSTFRLRDRAWYGLRGFDGKPFHPPFTDVPVGAYVIAPVLDLVGYIGRDRTWGRDAFVAASYTLLVGAAASLLAVVTGLADWMRMQPGSEVRRVTNAHLAAMAGVTALVAANLVIRWTGDRDATGVGLLILSLAILASVTFGAAIGGSLVFDKGYRVRKRKEPATDPEAAGRAS